MRPPPEEWARLGKVIAEKINGSTGPVTVLIPLRAISVISAPGQKFHDPAADKALFDSLKAGLRKDIAIVEMDCAINDAVFAGRCAQELLKNIAARKPAA